MSNSTTIDLKRLGLRTIHREGTPWYFLSDVIAALGFAPTGVTIMSRSLPEAEVSTVEVPAYRGNPTRLIVSQAGLFRLLIRGHSDASSGFRDWLCATVLPALLRDQRYTLPKSTKKNKAGPRRSFAQWDDAIGDPKAFLSLIQSDSAPASASDAAVGA